MKTEEIQFRLERGYTMAVYGTRENIHEQMTNDIKELLEAKNIVDTYKEQLNIPLVVWRCNRTLYMEGTKDVAFTKGNEYKQTSKGLLEAIDDEGTPHGIGGKWEKYFTAI